MEAVGKVVACFRFGWVHWAGLVAVEAASLRDRRASELRSTAISSAPPPRPSRYPAVHPLALTVPRFALEGRKALAPVSLPLPSGSGESGEG